MDAERIASVIASSLRAEGTDAGVAQDIAFHMTDWLDDLPALVAFFESPDRYSAREVYDLLGAFLVHAPNHLAAATKLYTGVPLDDVFGVGATLGDGQPDG